MARTEPGLPSLLAAGDFRRYWLSRGASTGADQMLPVALGGRVSALNSVFIGASHPLGEFESGGTAALFGPVASVVMGDVGTGLVVLVWTKLFPALARHDQLVRIDEDKGDRA